MGKNFSTWKRYTPMFIVQLEFVYPERRKADLTCGTGI